MGRVLLNPTPSLHPTQCQPPPPASDILGMVAGIEGGLQDTSGEDNFIFGWQVVGVHSLWGHTPPEGRRETEAQAPVVPLCPTALPSFLQGPLGLCSSISLATPFPQPWSTALPIFLLL